jgi:hypothetical protein
MWWPGSGTVVFELMLECVSVCGRAAVLFLSAQALMGSVGGRPATLSPLRQRPRSCSSAAGSGT